MRNPIMTGERLYLRPEEVEDAPMMARWYAEEIDDFTDDFGRYPVSPLVFEHYARKENGPDLPTVLTLQACLKENDELIGLVGLSDIDWINRTAETFSSFAPGPYRGRGYGTEAKLLLLEYSFDRLGLHVIQSYVWEANARSAAALGKQGYQPAGRLKWDGTRRGVYMDALLFDIKREEWLAAREALQSRAASA